MNTNKLVVALFRCVSVLSFLGLLLPIALLAVSEPFPHRLAGAGLFLIVGLQKVWAMYFRMRNRARSSPDMHWTIVAVGFAYTAVLYMAILEFFWYAKGFRAPVASAAGALLYLGAAALQHRAFAVLGHQWAVHVDQPIAGRRLIQEGPYRWVRHPLYLANTMEALAIPLLLNAPLALALGLLVFLPVEVLRARYEEGHLRRIFGEAYAAYALRVRPFIPLPLPRKPPRPGRTPAA